MDLWEQRRIIAVVATPLVIIIFYALLRLQRWKTSEEIHLSRFDCMFMKGKYFILGNIIGSGISYIIMITGL